MSPAADVRLASASCTKRHVHNVRAHRWLAKRFGATVWRTRTDPVGGRRRALGEEVAYWRDWVATGGGKWAEDYKSRFDATAVIGDPALRAILEALNDEEIAIVDVGAGPVSTVGYRFPGKKIRLVPVDPLADEYDRMLAKAGVVPPVKVARAHGERLVEELGPATFDIAYARNAIDHAVDPLPIVQNMFAVVRPGGHVVLRHVRNEPVRQAYVQLHQWNFDRRDDQFIAWRPEAERNISEAFAGHAVVRCSIEPASDDDDFEWVVCVIRKNLEQPIAGSS